MKKAEIPKYIVDLGTKHGATDVVAKLIEIEHIMIRFSNNEVNISKSFRENIIEVFLKIKRHRAGSTFGVLSAKTLEKQVKTLIGIAKISPPADVYAPLPQGPFKYDSEKLNFPQVSLDPGRLIRYTVDAIGEALAVGANRVAGSMVAKKSKTILETSKQASGIQKSSSLEISVRAFTSDISSGHSISIARNEQNFQPKAAGRVAGRIAKMALNPKQGEPGKYTALLSPLVFSEFVNQMGISSSAFLVDSGQSFLKDKIGSRVASESFSLTDDPNLYTNYPTRAFDDEGVPTTDTTIVQNGILKSFLHNSTTAKKFKVQTTGNAGLILPLPLNLVVNPGKKSFKELLSGIDEGIYVTNIWYLRYQNYRKGDFSTIPRDGIFQIKNGQIKRPIRDLRISDNMLQIFHKIQQLSKSRVWVKWWEVNIPTFTPFAVIEELNFTRSTI